MPTLDFKGKSFVYARHLSVPFRELVVDAMVAANTGRKKLLVFVAAKFMSQRELSRLGVDVRQLPYAIHRILGIKTWKRFISKRAW